MKMYVHYNQINCSDEEVKEVCIMPSGKIVVMVGEEPNMESLWFYGNGFNPKGHSILYTNERGLNV